MKSRKKSAGNSTFLTIHRADLSALHSRWLGTKLCTRQTVYVSAILETANYLGRREFTLTRDRISAATGLCVRRLTEIMHDLQDAGLLTFKVQRKPSGEFAPWEIVLCGKTEPRGKYRERGDIMSSGPWDNLGSDKCPHSNKTPSGGFKYKKQFNTTRNAGPSASRRSACVGFEESFPATCMPPERDEGVRDGR